MPYRITLEKENFKFSCSHFTIFGPREAERLHGHNYYVSVEITLDSIDSRNGIAFDFNTLKPLIVSFLLSLDEYILLPENSPYLQIDRSKVDSVRVSFHQKHYEFPISDVKILPVVNVSSEELARFLAQEIKIKMDLQPEIFGCPRSLSVRVQETRGQSVLFELEF